MTRRPLRIGALLVLLLITASLSNAALAKHDEGPTFTTPRPLDSSLMEAFQKNLSGSMWLIAQGLDPRLTTAKGNPLGREFPPQSPQVRGIAPQAGGGGQGPLVPYRSPSPKFSRNILVTRDFSRVPFQTEPHLAVNPKDPEHIILGVIDYNFPGITTYNSIDGGASWEGPYQVKYPAGDIGGAGDPVIAFDRDGNAYAASISVDIEEFTIRNSVGNAAVSSIPIAVSSDGGFTWSEPIASATSHIDTGPPQEDPGGRTTYDLSLPFLDKPWLAIGPSSNDPDKDIIYVTYTKFVTIFPIFFLNEVEAFALVPRTETSIELVRSEDGGLTWSEPVSVSPIVITSVGEDVPKRVVQGSQPAVAPDGTVYVNWVDSTDDDSFKGRAEIHVATSEDDGRTFVTNRASDFNEIPFSPRNTFFRYWGANFPQISAGPQGEVYVAFTGLPKGEGTDDGDIYFVASTDKGETWTTKKRINDDNTTRLQFFPSISTGPDGTIHAIWGDMRDDAVETRYHVYYSSSEDGGETWIENARVTDFPSNPNYAFPGGAFIGDYFTIAATEDEVYMAWPDARLGEFGSQNQKIAFARKGLMPLPSIFLSPPSGPGGKDVTIQGSNFQPDQDVYLEISGAVVSTVRSDPDGRFTARLFIPISGEGAHDFRAIDASGNIATGSFYMDFGFDNIQESIQGINDRLDSVGVGPVGDDNAQLTSIQDSLSSLDQLPEIQASLEDIKAAGMGGDGGDDGGSEGVSPLLVTVVAALAALGALILGLFIGSVRSRSRL